MMKLDGTETLINLARSFAGEAQARNRYHFYASVLQRDGHEALYRTVTEIENNELAHAKVFLNFLTANSSFGYENIDITAGYPYKLGNSELNLKSAAEGENDEATVIYPKFAEIARSENFPEIAAAYDFIASVESEHEKTFSAMHAALSSGTLYKRDKPVIWRCENCGYEYTSENAYEICPLCKHPIGYMRARPEA